jgi:hypothetical protein
MIVVIPVMGVIAVGSWLAWRRIPEKGRRHPTLLESDDLPTVMHNLSHRQLYFVRFDF